MLIRMDPVRRLVRLGLGVIQWGALHLLAICSAIIIFFIFVTMNFNQPYGSSGPDIELLAVDGPVVDTKSGKVLGIYTAEAQVFLSIPYAKPPVGDLRWRDPEPRDWEGTWNATHYPPMCPQKNSDEAMAKYNCSEDCLYLNIFAPRDANPNSSLPVMVFIHGGAFITGYSALPVYDGQYIANHTDTIVVTLNYRLGVLGFLAFKGSASDEVLGGNYGLRDQRLAMQWVQDNIQGFGGNREAITLWGQSAGAMSVAIHMSSPLSKGLFSKAIIESNPFGLPYDTLDTAQHWGNLFARKVSCKTVACLRKMSTDKLIKKERSPRWWGILQNFFLGKPKSELMLHWSPNIDNVDLYGQPRDILMASGTHIPMLVGTTSNEMWLFVYHFKHKIYKFMYKNILKMMWSKTDIDAITNFYPPSHSVFTDIRPQLANLSTDMIFTCATRFAARKAVVSNATRAWLYDFTHISSQNIGTIPACDHLACHSDELPFVFHNLNGSATAEEVRLADEMVSYWTSFARYGDPNEAVLGEAVSNGRSLMTWPEYTVTSTTQSGTKHAHAVQFDAPTNVVMENYKSEACSLWDRIGYNF